MKKKSALRAFINYQLRYKYTSLMMYTNDENNKEDKAKRMCLREWRAPGGCFIPTSVETSFSRTSITIKHQRTWEDSHTPPSYLEEKEEFRGAMNIGNGLVISPSKVFDATGCKRGRKIFFLSMYTSVVLNLLRMTTRQCFLLIDTWNRFSNASCKRCWHSLHVKRTNGKLVEMSEDGFCCC